MKKYLIYLAIIIVLAFVYIKFFKGENKYKKFFKDMGFGDNLLNKFTKEELFYSYNYIVNYSRKGIPLTSNTDPQLYAKVKAINDKFHIFTNLK